MTSLERKPFSLLRPDIPGFLRDKENSKLESRLFNLIALLCGMMGFLLSILSEYNPNSPYDLVLSLTVMIFGLGSYISSIFLHNDKYLRIPMVMLLTGILSVAWITSGGLNGSVPLYFMVSLIAIRILLEGGPAKTFLFLIFMIVIGLILLDFYFPEQIVINSDESSRKFNIGIALLISLTISTALMHLVVKEFREEKDRNFLLYQQTLKDKARLESAFAEIDMLKGILPLCSFCKKIRDDDNEWHSLEKYISKRSKVEFSHSFCPECGDKHYSEFTK